MANREQRRANDFDVRKYIQGSNAIEGIFDEKEIDQSLVAWAHLEAIGDVLTHSDICKIQKIITLNQTDLAPNQRGFYRGMAGNNVNVRVGEHLAPDHSYVENLMINWLNDVPKMTPLIGHIRFESIHPFVDGNGRTGRMLYWYVCKRRGIKPKYYGTDTLPDRTAKENREAYYRLFDNKKVVELSNNNWAINFKYKYRAKVKGTDGKVYTGEYMHRPSDAEIKKGLPKDVDISGVPLISEIK